jgi:hypothetical protein
MYGAFHLKLQDVILVLSSMRNVHFFILQSAAGVQKLAGAEETRVPSTSTMAPSSQVVLLVCFRINFFSQNFASS